MTVGQCLAVFEVVAPDARVINLETSVTRSADFAPGKPICYRMSPDNLPAVTMAHPDACALANNHVLDLGRTGLAETLDALASAGLPAIGAGRDIAEAWQPAAVPVPGGGPRSLTAIPCCFAQARMAPLRSRPDAVRTARRPGPRPAFRACSMKGANCLQNAAAFFLFRSIS
jgi:poly-gamma-glutamate capsule biosynthesis protein CapA/YwtB (metallophosphatase superfamily)